MKLRQVIPSFFLSSNISMEADSSQSVEREKVFYCRIDDFTQLENADRVENQEQWELRPKETDTGCIRVRKTSLVTVGTEHSPANVNETFIMTTKIYTGENGAVVETEQEVSPDIFEAFKRIAPSGLIKRRFTFNIPNSAYKWEVDVFFDEHGDYAEWCKVDLEMDNLNEPTPPFPIQFSEVISGNREIQSEEEKARIRTLFQTLFITQNPAVKKVSMERLASHIHPVNNNAKTSTPA